MLEISTVADITLTPTITEMTENPKLSAYLVEHVETQTIPQRKITMEPMQQTDHFSERANRQDGADINYRTNRTIELRVSRLRPKL